MTTDMVQRTKAKQRLIVWLSGWAVLYVASVLLYNYSYPFTRDVLINKLQVLPAAWIVELTLPTYTIVCDEAAIRTGRYCLEVMRGCDGIEAWLLLATSLAVFPMAMRRRLYSILIGTLLIYSLNRVRIICSYLMAIDVQESALRMIGYEWLSTITVAPTPDNIEYFAAMESRFMKVK